uniref:Uncharacterized protein n=1 Tax=Rhizophora mucronata TaxID=61149 RepID=A0A2P2MV69_RHIMU
MCIFNSLLMTKSTLFLHGRGSR